MARLHELLVRIALGEVGRRGPRLRITGPELEDLAYQAAADALMAITRKVGQFRGDSRFNANGAVNAIPYVCAAPPGILTTGDLPHILRRGPGRE